jgi:hypothetical protein
VPSPGRANRRTLVPMTDERMRGFENRDQDVHVRGEQGSGGTLGGRGLTIALLAVLVVFVVLIVLLFLR